MTILLVRGTALGCVTGGSRDPVVSDVTVSVVAAWVLLNVTWLLLLGVLVTVDVTVLLGYLHAALDLRCVFNNSSLSFKVVSGGSPERDGDFLWMVAPS